MPFRGETSIEIASRPPSVRAMTVPHATPVMPMAGMGSTPKARAMLTITLTVFIMMVFIMGDLASPVARMAAFAMIIGRPISAERTTMRR